MHPNHAYATNRSHPSGAGALDSSLLWDAGCSAQLIRDRVFQCFSQTRVVPKSTRAS